MALSSRARFGVILGGLVALGVVLSLAAIGYWQYVHIVPPFHPTLSSVPNPNGFDTAKTIVMRLHRRHPQPSTRGWPVRTVDQLPAQLAPIRPDLDAVRKTFGLEWGRQPILKVADATAYDSHIESDFRECAHWLRAESVLAHHQADDAQALQSALDAIDLGSHFCRGGDSLDRLSANACATIGFVEAEQRASGVPGTAIPAALARVRRLRNDWPPLSEMLERERAIVLVQMNEGFRKHADWDIVSSGTNGRS